MLIQVLDTPGFVIDDANKLTRHARWLLSAESDDGDFAVAAMLWAGSVGADWRVPNAAGTGYTTDNSIRIEKVECKVLTASACEIHFTGVPRVTAAVRAAGSLTVEQLANLEQYKSAVFNVPASLLNSYLPQAGDALTWAGEDYLCESVKAVEQPDGSFAATIRAVDASVLSDGEISSRHDADGELKTGVWLVEEESLESFLSSHALHSAASWAGADFYVSSVRTEPADSALRTRVTLEARCSSLTMLEALRHEVLEGYAGGVAQTSIVWVSRWRATAADHSHFRALLGTSAASWAETGFVITQITPKRISDCEFEYVMEARKTNSICPVNIFWRDDDLPNRVEYSVRYGDMYFAARYCGFYWNYHGLFLPLPNWAPLYQCPLVTTGVLPYRFLCRTQHLLEIVQVSYLSGTSESNLTAITTMFSGSRVSTQTFGSISGSWLLSDYDVDDYTDARNRKWTRITKVFRLSPSGYTWNPNFF